MSRVAAAMPLEVSLGIQVASPTAAAFDPVDPGKLLSAASADSLTDLAISTAPVPLDNS